VVESVKSNSGNEIEAFLDHSKSLIDSALSGLFLEPWAGRFGRLSESMRYSLLAGGKRIRPILSMASLSSLGHPPEPYIPLLLPLELIHTYSLIHDDLPAMDNDDLRRGKPTNHVVFGDATAILAGDALLTYAFTMLSDPRYDGLSPERVRLAVVRELAHGSGLAGMVGGQMLDMESEGRRISLSDLEFLHRHKTGALILSSVRIGALIGQGGTSEMKSLDQYGEAVGVAFQIADDLLDVEGDVATLGKAAQKDTDHLKNTYPGLLGIEGAKKMAKEKLEAALDAVSGLGEKADHLRGIARYIIERRN